MVASPPRRRYGCAMMTARRFLLSLLCAVLLSTGPVEAQTKPKPKTPPPPAPHSAPAAPVPGDPGPAKALGTSGSWTAYLAQNKNGKVCYVVGAPEKADPSVKRKTVMAMVTHRTQDAVANVVSFDEGYPLNEEVDVVLEVGGAKFALFAKDDSAWARTADLDKTIVAALIKEKQAVVRATPKKGRQTIDTYSLAGFSKALGLIDQACDVKR
jgi:hypothetical protein